MELKINLFGADGSDAKEFEDLLWSLVNVDDVTTRYTTHDTHWSGEIQACAAIPIVKYVVAYAFLKFTDEALKDAYKAAKSKIFIEIEKWQAMKNERLEARHRIHFTISEGGELLVDTTDESPNIVSKAS